ncbi:hypothetical protein C8R43DRAFT_965796 [Mycena crocata]|nr:hypothetical protein C8R43DRAFT_965796 [Mycena crocata]
MKGVPGLRVSTALIKRSNRSPIVERSILVVVHVFVIEAWRVSQFFWEREIVQQSDPADNFEHPDDDSDDKVPELEEVEPSDDELPDLPPPSWHRSSASLSPPQYRITGDLQKGEDTQKYCYYFSDAALAATSATTINYDIACRVNVPRRHKGNHIQGAWLMVGILDTETEPIEHTAKTV